MHAPLVLLSIPVLILTLALPAQAQADAELAATSGSVEVGRGEPPVWQAAQLGQRLQPGDAIRTGDDGRAELALASGRVRLYPNSLLHVRPPDAPGVGLERGSSLLDILKSRTPTRFEVETPEAVVVVKGTRFLVRAEPGDTQVAVYRGLVGLRHTARTLAREILIPDGFALVGGGGRSFELVDHGGSDPWEMWERGAAPLYAPAPARRALDQARRAALRQSRPELRARILNVRPNAKRLAKPKVGPRPLAEERKAKELQRKGPKLELDAIDGPLQQSAYAEFAESMIEGSTGGSMMEITVVTSGGPNYVKVTAPGVADQLFDPQLEDIIQNGNTTQYSVPLLTLLTASGVDPIEFAEVLEDML